MERGWTHRHAECTHALHTQRHQISQPESTLLVFPAECFNFILKVSGVKGNKIKQMRGKRGGIIFLHTECVASSKSFELCV